jgi:hypothetical protein
MITPFTQENQERSKLDISNIRRDGGTQPRAAIDFAVAYEYGEAIKDGQQFPPVVAFYDGADYWLADGFHRVEGAYAEGLTEIECEVHQGTQQDAQWYSFSANKANGLRRTNDDKQRAVKAALAHPRASSLSNYDIARHCGVAESTIRNWRTDSPSAQDAQIKSVTRNGKTYQQRTGNIGKGKKDAVSSGTSTSGAEAEIQEVETGTVEQGNWTPRQRRTKAKILNAVNYIRGAISVIPEVNVPAIRSLFTAQEITDVESIAEECANILHALVADVDPEAPNRNVHWIDRVLPRFTRLYQSCSALSDCDLNAGSVAMAIKMSSGQLEILTTLGRAHEYIGSVIEKFNQKSSQAPCRHASGGARELTGRKLAMASAGKRRFIEAISLVSGAVKGVSESNIAAIKTQLTPEELGHWSGQVMMLSKDLAILKSCLSGQEDGDIASDQSVRSDHDDYGYRSPTESQDVQ